MTMPNPLKDGRYTLQKPIGNPGMSEVYLAKDAHVKDRLVVVKLVRIAKGTLDENQNQQDALENFDREVGILAKSRYNRIVEIYDYGREEQGNDVLAYMVMPYCEEGSLQDWLRKYRANNPLEVTEVAELLDQAGAALKHLHDREIVHRDIKSTNFLVDSLLEPSALPNLWLTDFGFAQIVGEDTSQDDRGTYPYKAPEQWANARPVCATDQYQLAIMTYYLLTRKHPFEGSRDEIRNKHIFDDPPAPSKHSPNIPSKVDKVILRALEKKPRKRYPSVKAFTKEFNKASKPGLGRPGWMGWPLFIVMLVALISSLSLNAFLYIQYAPHPIVLQNVIKTCPSGPYTFQIQELLNAHEADREYIGISDSSCYIFTTENNTQLPDQAETTIDNANLQVPIDKPHITIIVATMLSNYDNTSYISGRSMLRGAAIAQQEYNEHRGAGQLPLRLLIANSGTNEYFAPQIAQEIVKLQQTDPSILGVMGWPFSTDEAKEALATLKQARISSVSSSLSSTQFDGLSPYFFRINPSDVSQGIVGATYLLQQSIKYVIVCEDPRNPYSASLAETFKESFMTQASGSDPSVVYYQRGALSTGGEKLSAFESSVQQDITNDEIRLGAQPNQIAVYFAGYADDFASFRVYLNSEYPQVVVMGGDGLSDYFASPPPFAGTDFYFTTFADYHVWDSSPNPPCFIAQYKTLFNPNEIGSVNNLSENDGVLAYDATDALLEAYINARGSASSVPSLKSMQSQLTQVSFLGVSGPIALSPSGTPSSKAVYIEYYGENSTTLKNPPSLSTPQSFPFCQSSS